MTGVGAELVVGVDWAHDRLVAALTGPVLPPGGVWLDVAPSSIDGYPRVILQVQSPGTDYVTLNGVRVWSSPLLVAKVIGRTASYVSLKAYAVAIDAALHRAQGSTPDGAVLQCWRVAPFALAERVGGVDYRHLGGQYRMLVQGGS